ncbi:hypothetical protein CRU94_07905 [Arcobacter sp. AHV-9/2010]|uniref:hypothetical protein n=1 Tax=Arcobacter sp. AHV-9/2010 TaxID=2021861 RepID=UPI00100C10A9|nr:hypothetical protein [Arcobacter sp. CECT 9299]RXJ94682.1 hypothetical protein CRU94_07905 [Arcobacter sp. CECT 9299]
MQNLSDIQKRYFERAKQEIGEEKALEVLNDWDNRVAQSISIMEMEDGIKETYEQIINSNKKNLVEIYIGGDYFNNKDSYFSSSKDGFLQLENIASKEVFKTLIPYEDFKEYARANINSLAEILAYIHTSDIELMSRITKSISIDQLEHIVFE